MRSVRRLPTRRTEANGFFQHPALAGLSTLMANRSALFSDRIQPWIPSAIVAMVCGTVYLAFRPPIFDSDGYSDLLAALGPNRIDNIDPLHLLSVPIQILLVTIVGAKGYPPTMPFQVLGIALNCATLFLFGALLLKCIGSRLFVLSATLFVAFSPRFWYAGFQNTPYPLLLLAKVLCLLAWRTNDGNPPSGLRLAGSTLCLSIGILIHVVAIVLIPAGAAALALGGREPFGRRLVRSIFWAAGVGVVVLTIYLYAWWLVTHGDPGFLAWTTGNLVTQDPPHFEFPKTLIQSVVGALGVVVQDDALRSFLSDNLSTRLILTLYAGAGLLICAATGWWIRSTGSFSRLLALLWTNSLFTLSALFVAFWSVVVIAWEPVTSNHWVFDLFPLLVCLGLMLRDRHEVTIFATVVLILSALNLYLDHAQDQSASRDAPEVLAATINRHLGEKDIFIVLANEDWYGDVEYELLFRYLKVASDERGVAILNDYVLPAGGTPSWRGRLRDRIDSAVDAGGNAYIAGSVLDPDSYKDLAYSRDAFSPKGAATAREYNALDGPALLRDIRDILSRYDLQDSDFKLGDDQFLVIHGNASRKA